MASSELEELQRQLSGKMAAVKKLLQLRALGREAPLRPLVGELGPEVEALHFLLERLEAEVERQRQLAAELREVRSRAEVGRAEAERLKAAIPPEVKGKVEGRPVKKPLKEEKFVKDVALISAEEFEAVPSYMRGRLSLAQTNAALQALHAAAIAKYRILHQPFQSLPPSGRSLYRRFQEEETIETKGAIFVVEADVKEFAHHKVDKRFHSLLNVLRHCQRIREVRGGRLVRYVLC